MYIQIIYYCSFIMCCCIGLIETGWEAPAGQMYSSVADLAELMMLIFRDMDPYVPNTKQVQNIHTKPACGTNLIHT